jgi:hypothetical protein
VIRRQTGELNLHLIGLVDAIEHVLIRRRRPPGELTPGRAAPALGPIVLRLAAAHRQHEHGGEGGGA